MTLPSRARALAMPARPWLAPFLGRPARACVVPLLAIALLAGCAAMPGAAPDYAAVVASPVRTEQDRRMDAVRHPVEFLAFAQARPGMRALDVSAGGGYTTQLLALAAMPGGIVWGQTPRPGETLTRRLAEHPQPGLVIVTRPFDDPVPPEAQNLDLITLVLNYHDIANLPVDRVAMNRRLYSALKPGGVLVIVDHAAPDGSGTADTRTLHRIDEAVVRREVEQAGFVLDREGSFLRNPADPRERTSTNSPFPTDKFALRFVKRG